MFPSYRIPSICGIKCVCCHFALVNTYTCFLFFNQKCLRGLNFVPRNLLGILFGFSFCISLYFCWPYPSSYCCHLPRGTLQFLVFTITPPPPHTHTKNFSGLLVLIFTLLAPTVFYKLLSFSAVFSRMVCHLLGKAALLALFEVLIQFADIDLSVN